MAAKESHSKKEQVNPPTANGHTPLESLIVAYRPLLEISPDPSIIYDTEGKVCYTNPIFSETFGWSLKELCGHRLDFVPEENMEETKAAVGQMFAKGIVTGFITQRLTKNGRVLDTLQSGTLLKDANGETVGSIVIIRDITEQKEIERALEASQDRYREMLDSTEDAYYEVDLQGNITYFSHGLADVLGYPEEALLGLNNRDYADEENAAKIYAAFNQVYKSRQPIKALLMNTVRQDGTPQVLETSISLMEDEAGDAIGFRGIARDVTALIREREEAEAALQKSEERYRTILSSIEDGYYETNLEGEFVFINDQWAALYDRPPADILNADFRHFTSAPEGERIFTYFNEMFRTKTPIKSLPHQIILPDGRVRHLEMSATYIEEENGKITGFRGVGRDVTDRIQAEQVLRESEIRYRTILESIEDGYYEADLKGNFTFLNDQLGAVIGYEPEELKGMNYRDYTTPETAEKVLATFNRVLKTGEPVKGFVWEALDKRGRVRHLETYVLLRYDEEGEPIGFRGVGRDVTGRIQAEEALAEALVDQERVAAQLATVARVSTAVSTILDPQEMLQAVVNLTKENFNLYHAHIYLLNEAGDTLELVTGAGEIGKQMVQEGRQIPLAQEQSLVAQAARTHTGINTKDVRQDPHFLSHPLLPDTRSELAVPLIVGDEVLGVLDVQSEIVNRFTQKDINIQTTLAAQIAVALQNTRRFLHTQQSEEKYRTIIENIEDGYFEVDLRGTFVFANESVCTMTGYRYEKLIGLNYRDYMTGEMAQHVFDGFNRIYKTGEPEKSFDYEIIHKDGQILKINSSVGLIKNARGEAIGFRGIMRDITKRLEAEEEIRFQQTLLVAQSEASPDGILIVTTGREIIFYNQNFVQLWGLPEDVLATRSSVAAVDYVVNQVADPAAFTEMSEYLYEHPEASAQDEVLLQDGRVLDRRSQPITHPDGSIYGRVWYFRDITERKRDEQTILQQREFLSTIIESMPLGLFAKDAKNDYQFTIWNRAMYELFGASPAQMIGKTDYEINTKKDADLYRETDVAVMARKEVVDIPVEEIVTPNGRRLAHTIKIPIYDNQGQPDTLVGIIEDITERIQGEEALREAHGRAQDILESVTTPLLISRVKDGKIQYANQLLADLVDVSLPVLMEQGTPDFYVRAEDRQEIITQLQAQGDVVNYELELKRTGGQHFWALLSARLFDFQNEPAIITTLIDITERKKAQEDITRQAAIIDNAETFMATGTLEGIISFINPYGAHLLGYEDPQELVGRSFAEFQPETAKEFEKVVLPTIMEKGSWRGESSMYGADGRQITVDMTVFFLRDRDGRPTGTATNAIDITARKEAEARLQHQAEIETLGRALSASFLDMPHEQIDTGIADALKMLGEFARVDRAYLFRFVDSDAGVLMQNTHEWCAQGIEPQIDRLQALPYDDYLFFKGFMERQEVYHFPRVADMPPEAGPEKEEYELEKIQSIIIIPLVTGGQTVGFMGFDSVRREKAWDETDIGLLQLAGDILVSTINRQEAAQALETALAESERLYEMSARLNATTNTAEIIEAAVVPVVAGGLTAGNLFTLELDEDGRPQYMTMAADWTTLDREATPTLVPVGTRFNLKEIPVAQEWIDRPDEVLLYGDVDNDPSLDEITRGYYQMGGIKASAILPLRAGNAWVGLLTLSWQETKAFTADDARLYRSLADQTAVILNNQLLFEQTQKRAAELATVAEVGAAVTTERDSDLLLQRVVDLTRERFDLYHAHIYLLYENRLVLTQGAGEIGRQMVAEKHTISLDRKQSLIARAARSRQGVVANNVHEDPDFLPHPLLPQTKSEMAVPIVVGEEVLGVLDVQSEQENQFNEENVRTYSTLAAQIGVALQNARSFARSESALRELEEVTRRLQREGWQTYLDSTHKAGLSFGFDQKEIRPLELTAPVKPKKKKEANGSGMVKPLRVQGQSIGQLLLSQPEQLTQDADDIMTAVAERLSAHIENLRLTEQTQFALAETEEQARRLTQLNAISSELSEAENLQQVLDTAVARIPELFPIDRTSILWLTPDGQNLQVMAFYGEESELPQGHLIPVADSVLGDVIRQNRVITGKVNNSDMVSARFAPLTIGGRPFGTMNIASKKPDAYDEQDDNLLLQLSTILSSIIENKRLLAAAQARAERERQVRTIADMIRRGTSQEEILRIARQEIGQLLGAKQSVAHLGTAVETNPPAAEEKSGSKKK